MLLSGNKIISFNKDGHDPFIDFLKAYAILCVVVGHALPVALYDYTLFYIWGGMQVPMFVLIQTFHAYKKDIRPHFVFSKICKRIIYPYLMIQTVIALFLILFSSDSACYLITRAILGGGMGPGSYYPWIYIQMAVTLVFLWPVANRYSIRQLLMPFVVVCVAFDIFFSIIDMPEYIYRLMAVRYIFLVWLGLIWVRDGIQFNKKYLFFSLLSIIVTVFLYYNTANLEPFLYTTGWKIHRWLCYFYVAFVLPAVCWYLFRIVHRISWLDSLFREIGRCSYEIFLIQMAVFVFLPPILDDLIPTHLFYYISLPLELFLSVYLGILIRRLFVYLNI